MTEHFIDEFYRLQNRHSIAWFLFLQASRWFGFRTLLMLEFYLWAIVIATLAAKDSK
jgi:hypothetical protein